MPLAEVGYTADDYNSTWRGDYGQGLSGADKRDIARELGVSVRTVQRWTTTGAEQRNPIPSRLNGVPQEDWPTSYQTRGEFTRRTAYGGTNEETDTGLSAEFGEVRGTLTAAQRFARDLEAEVVDPWLTLAWREYRIVKTDRGWEVRVVYDALVSPGGQKVP